MKGEKKKGREREMVRKTEKIIIAAIILIAFVGSAKNRFVFILRNVGDRR